MARPPAPKPSLTFEQIDAAKKRRTREVQVTLDADTTPPTLATFKLGAIGRPGWELLVNEHPPTDEQQAEHKAEQQGGNVPPLLMSRLRWNPDTFPPALIAAASIEPKLSDDQALTLWNDERWSARECSELFDAALEVNDPQREAIIASLGKGSTPTRGSAPS